MPVPSLGPQSFFHVSLLSLVDKYGALEFVDWIAVKIKLVVYLMALWPDFSRKYPDWQLCCVHRYRLPAAFLPPVLGLRPDWLPRLPGPLLW